MPLSRDEFDSWLAYHCARFHWVNQMIEGEIGIADNWFTRLQKSTSEHLREATDEMMTFDPQPKAEEHLGKLIGRTRELRFTAPKNIDYTEGRVESYKCLDCHDRGVIEVYHAMAYEPIRNGSFLISPHLRTCVSACYCEEGDKNRPPLWKPTKNGCRRPMARFSHNTMKKVTEIGADEQAAELIHFVKNDWLPRNHNQEFQDWSR